ncbi:MAG: D-tyrosyl-tRNA(Tyr) deacylase [Bacilli bacterium]|nr:D-tyrosyl-tRNA(Tyr) deacylase [Bacilli bacterium]
MRVVVQRSLDSYVSVNNQITGKIDNGLVILVGFTLDDDENDINYIVKKIIGLRIFDDENGIMNLSIKDINGSILSISQFTLYADTTKGNRPSYINAMKGEYAIKLYEEFNNKLKENDINVQTGIFGAEMDVHIRNDGPVTILIDSKVR